MLVQFAHKCLIENVFALPPRPSLTLLDVELLLFVKGTSRNSEFAQMQGA